MAEPEALEKVPSGRKAKYADNILPLVILLILLNFTINLMKS